jgi:hypothetical protein
LLFIREAAALAFLLAGAGAAALVLQRALW